MYRKNIRLVSAIPDWTALERIPASERGDAPQEDMFKRVSKERVDQGLVIAKDLSEDLCVRLQHQLQLPLEPHRLYVSLMSSEEFVRRYSADMVVQTEFGFPGHEGIYCLCDYSFAQSAINRVTGGPGDAQIENEELTAMERAVFESVLHEMLYGHSRAWRSVIPMTPQQLAITAPKLGGKEAFLEMSEVVVLSAEVKRADNARVYTLRWVYSAEGYSRCIEQWERKAVRAGAAIVLSPEAVSMVDVPIKAELGKAIVSMADLMLLQRGDVIVLDKYINDPVQVDVGNDARFSAQAGEFSGCLAVQLLTPILPAIDQEGPVSEEQEEKRTPSNEKRDQGPEKRIASAGALSGEDTESMQDGSSFDAEDEGPAETQTPVDDDDILANIEDEDDSDDEEFVWDENESTDEDF